MRHQKFRVYGDRSAPFTQRVEKMRAIGLPLYICCVGNSLFYLVTFAHDLNDSSLPSVLILCFPCILRCSRIFGLSCSYAGIFGRWCVGVGVEWICTLILSFLSLYF